MREEDIHDCKNDAAGEGHCNHPSHIEREPTDEEVEEFIKYLNDFENNT